MSVVINDANINNKIITTKLFVLNKTKVAQFSRTKPLTK